MSAQVRFKTGEQGSTFCNTGAILRILKKRATRAAEARKTGTSMSIKDSDPLLNLFILSNLCCGVPERRHEPKARSHKRE